MVGDRKRCRDGAAAARVNRWLLLHFPLRTAFFSIIAVASVTVVRFYILHLIADDGADTQQMNAPWTTRPLNAPWDERPPAAARSLPLPLPPPLDLGPVLDELENLTDGRAALGLECPGTLQPYRNRIVRTSQRRHIPNILHVSMASRCLPGDLIEYIHRWENRLPSHSVFFHDDAAVARLIQSEWPEFPDLHEAMKCVQYKGAMTIDIWRVLVLYRYGGVYTDIDNWPRDTFTEETIPANVTGFTFSDMWNRPSQWFMAFEPGHPTMNFTVQQIVCNVLSIEDINRPNVIFVTGPGAVKKGYERFMNTSDDIYRTGCHSKASKKEILTERFANKTYEVIFDNGYHTGAAGKLILKHNHTGRGNGASRYSKKDVMTLKGFHNFGDIVEYKGRSMTRKERIQEETGVLHWTTVTRRHNKTAMSCEDFLNDSWVPAAKASKRSKRTSAERRDQN